MVRRILVVAAVLVVLAGCGGDKPDPMAPQQWALSAIRVPHAWQQTMGEDVVIAIVDTGVDTTHPDLKSKIVDGYDFVDNDTDPRDLNGHGTHVAGIAAAVTGNGVGIAGAAPKAWIMPVRVLGTADSGDQAKIAKGVIWAADHDAKVINLSLGESGLLSRLLRSGALNPAIRHAAFKGAVVVAAAGSEGFVDQPYKPPAQVLVVGASDRYGRPADFSNVGVQGAVFAPGVNILSTLPTYQTPETLEYTGGYGMLDGTSMAAPYVAGLAALLLAQGKSADETLKAIRETAGNPGKDPRLGLGIVDAQAAVKRAS